jgi:LysM repeat protein
MRPSDPGPESRATGAPPPRDWDDDHDDRDDGDEGDDGGWVAAAPVMPPHRGVERPAHGSAGRTSSRRDPDPPGGHVRRLPEEPSDLFGPAWERPQRYEAYPTLRTRIGIPSLPRAGVAAAALILAALALFFIGPMLLGLVGPDDPGPGVPGASPSGSVAPSESVDPTPAPVPTPQLYVVAPGDTLSTIATRFGLTLADVLAANPQITNADRIAIGDEIIIPVPGPTSLPNEVPGGGSPSP